jgi:hypothetical protein
MKVGDLVRFSGGRPLGPGHVGLIIECSRAGHRSYKVWWMVQNKAGWPSSGWWDALRLEKVE